MGIFTRDESELLSYDEDAFFYFAAAILGLLLIPWTFISIKGLAFPKPLPDDDYDDRGMAKRSAQVRRCKAAAMEMKRQQVLQNVRSMKSRFGGGAWLRYGALVAVWICFGGVLMRLAETPAELCRFDPYAILGISYGADTKAIKKAYRKKSLQHHPDKDPDNPLAHVAFQNVAKAYAALTDDAARANYAKYGNPDGPTQTKVGVAIHPGLLASKDGQRRTLVIFFSVLFIVPFSIICCCLRGAHLSAGGVAGETIRIFNTVIDSDLKLEQCPGLLAASVEARRSDIDIRPLLKPLSNIAPHTVGLDVIVKVKDDAKGASEKHRGRQGLVRKFEKGAEKCTVQLDKGELHELTVSHLVPVEPNLPYFFIDPPIRQCSVLIWAHLLRQHSLMSPRMRAQLDDLLRRSVKLGRAMASAATSGGDKSGFFGVVKNIMHFRQCTVQALNFNSNPLLQIPHVTEVPNGAPAFDDVLENSAACDRLVAMLGLGGQQVLDVHAFREHVSRVSLSCKVEVADEDHIVEGDLATITVTLTRTNLREGEAVGPVHAPLWPSPKREEWWLLVYDELARRLVCTTTVLGQGQTEEATMRFLVAVSGPYRWRVYAMCDSYLGVDASVELNFTALGKREVDRKIFIHPDDADIRTMFEEIMDGLKRDDDKDSDTEDEDEDDHKNIPETPEEKPTEKPPDPCSSDDEPEREAIFYKVFSWPGYTVGNLYREPREDDEVKIGMLPDGNIVRGFEGEGPDGWILTQATASWMREIKPWMLEAAKESPPLPPGEKTQSSDGAAPDRVDAEGPAEDVTAKGEQDPKALPKGGGLIRLGPYYEQQLQTVLKPSPPLILVRRWMRRSEHVKVDENDVISVTGIGDGNARAVVEGLLRKKIGDATFEALRDKADAQKEEKKKRLSKAIGIYSSANGQVWQITAAGHVRGNNRDGTRIRDMVKVVDGRLRIGPFYLDETKTCSCIHWVREDDPSKTWTWFRDLTLGTRMRLGAA